MSEEESWINKRRREDWDNLPFLIRETVIEKLSANFNLEFSQELIKEINSNQDWWRDHENWGVELRAYLRNFYKDNELPKNDWEYYWVSAIEKSVERVIENNEKENA